MSQEFEQYDGMCEELNCDYENPDGDGTKNLPKIPENELITTEEIENETDSRFLSEEDEKYITKELKGTVQLLDSAMDTLNKDLGQGSSAKLYESMAQLGSARVGALKELRSMKTNRKSVELESRKVRLQEKKASISEKKLLGGNGDVGNGDDKEVKGLIAVSPRQMAEIMSEAKKIVNERSNVREVDVVPVEDAVVVNEKPIGPPSLPQKEEAMQRDTEAENGTVGAKKADIESKFKLG